MSSLQFNKNKIEIFIRKSFPNSIIESFEKFPTGIAGQTYKVKIRNPHKIIVVKLGKLKDKKTFVQNNKILNYLNDNQIPAPKVYFDILEKGGNKFVPLSDLATVKFGLKTGCNDFFIVKDITSQADDKLLQAVVNNIERITTIRQVQNKNLCLVKNGFNEFWLLEKQFLFPMLTSPKDLKTYSSIPDELPYSIFVVDLEKRDLKINHPYSFSYIMNGERKNLNGASSLSSRNKWYFVGSKTVPPLSFNYIISDSGKTFLLNAYSNNNFHNIYPKNEPKTIWLYLNSTFSWLTQQLIMRASLGEGAGKIETYDLAAIIIPNIDLENLKIDLGETKTYKDELGTLESLETVNPERVKLDAAILELIGYKDKTERAEVLLNLYRETYKLINSRSQKAQSLKGVKTQRNKIKFSVYVEQLKEMLVDGKYEAKNTFRFAKSLEKLVSEISSENKLQKKILDTYWKEKFGELFNEEKIANNDQIKLF